MQLNLQLRLFTEEYSWLCFRHAVLEVQRGQGVETEVGEYNVDHYLGSTVCEICFKEE